MTKVGNLQADRARRHKRQLFSHVFGRFPANITRFYVSTRTKYRDIQVDHFFLNPFSSLFTFTQLFRLVFYSDLLTHERRGVRIPVQVRDYFRFKTSRPALVPTQLLIQRVLALFPGTKRPVRESDHPPLSGAEFKNEWSYISTPPIFLHGKERENFAFIFTNARTTIIGVSYFSLLIFQVDLMQGDNVDREFGMWKEKEGLQNVGQGN